MAAQKDVEMARKRVCMLEERKDDQLGEWWAVLMVVHWDDLTALLSVHKMDDEMACSRDCTMAVRWEVKTAHSSVNSYIEAVSQQLPSRSWSTGMTEYI